MSTSASRLELCVVHQTPAHDNWLYVKSFFPGFSPFYASDCLFPLRPPPLPHPDILPRPSHPSGLDFGPFWLRFGPFRICLAFGSVWLRFGFVSGPFLVRFGVLGGVGVGSGRGASVREKNITIPCHFPEGQNSTLEILKAQDKGHLRHPECVCLGHRWCS